MVIREDDVTKLPRVGLWLNASKPESKPNAGLLGRRARSPRAPVSIVRVQSYTFGWQCLLVGLLAWGGRPSCRFPSKSTAREYEGLSRVPTSPCTLASVHFGGDVFLRPVELYGQCVDWQDVGVHTPNCQLGAGHP